MTSLRRRIVKPGDGTTERDLEIIDAIDRGRRRAVVAIVDCIVNGPFTAARVAAKLGMGKDEAAEVGVSVIADAISYAYENEYESWRREQ